MLCGRARIVALCWLSLSAVVPANAKEPAKGAIVRGPVCGPTSTQELTISARAVERPLMKYRLLPAENELRAGNAAPILLRLPWEQSHYFSAVVPTFSDYLTLPLNDPKLRSPRDVFIFYRELRRAAYRRTAEWDYPIRERPFADILLPDVQGAREIVGRGLSVWIRQRLSRGELSEAREGILVGLAVSRHYASSPFVITQLVCASLNSMMLSRLEELLSEPDCPNLYWALTALPRPLIDLRPSIELEQRSLEMTVPGLDDLEHLHTEDQWKQRLDGVVNVLLQELFMQTNLNTQPVNEARTQLLAQIVKRGRAKLPDRIEGGAARVAAMSDAEAGLRWYLRTYNDLFQDFAAAMSLEPPAALPRLKAAQERVAAFRSDLGLKTLSLESMFWNAYVAARFGQRRIDALRIVEAIRDYGATHGSRLPESLSKIVDPPVPDDPFTGKAFHYEMIDGTATLSGSGLPVNGQETRAIRYRIKMRQQAGTVGESDRENAR